MPESPFGEGNVEAIVESGQVTGEDNAGRQRRGNDDGEGESRSVGIDGDEQGVDEEPDHRGRDLDPIQGRGQDWPQMVGNVDAHHRGIQHVTDHLRESREGTPGRSQGSARIGVAATRERHHGRKFGLRQTEGEVHHGDEDRRDQEAAEAAGQQAGTPARELAGDDGPDTERKQRPRPSVALNLASIEVTLIDGPVGDLGQACHRPGPIMRRRSKNEKGE